MGAPENGEQRRPSIRNDLQGLRGWAVLAVIIFHFFPKLFAYGYLGVDIFFVLSGFLIALVINDKSPSSIITYKDFYFRRIRRIFPSLLTVVLIVMVYTVRLDQTRIYYQARSALYALSFTSNLKQSDNGEQYFLQLEKANDMLTHTWSLAVEVQFYLLAPIILLIWKKMSNGGWPFLTMLMFAMLFSFCFHVLSDDSTAFNNVFARLWQFLLGATIFNLEIVEEKKDAKCEWALIFKVISASTFVSTCILTFMWQRHALLRLCVTAAAALAIYKKIKSPLITHSSIVLLGDCSYSLYLLHWPAVCILKEHSVVSTSGIKVLTVVLCVVLSFLCNIYFEKWYLQLNQYDTTILVVVLYLINVVIILSFYTPLLHFIYGHTSEDNSTANIEWLTSPDGNWTLRDYERITIEEARVINRRFDEFWLQSFEIPHCKLAEGNNPPFGLCEVPNGDGNLTFMSIGNSYNANHARLVTKHFRPYYSSLHFHTRGSCLAIDDGTDMIEAHQVGAHCVQQEDPARVVEQRKPDILFVVQRFFTLDKPLYDFEHDEQFLLLMKEAEKLAKHTKKLFIMNALPEPSRELRKLILEGNDMEARTLADHVKSTADLIRMRLTKVAERCSNCILFDLFAQHLSVDGVYMNTDLRTKVNLFDNADHHTPYGLKKVEPVFERIAASFYQLLNASSPFNVVD